jgi:Cu/Ag efflux pump CusA
MRDAIRASNADVGGRTVELSEFEFMVRGPGYLKAIADIENIVLKSEQRHAGLLRDVARSNLVRTSGAASPNSTARARSQAASCCSASASTRST